jgi:hypothetical protein
MLNIENKLNEMKVYEKVFAKSNMSVAKLKEVANYYKVHLVTERYEKLGRKHFPKNPTVVEYEEIDAWQLGCYLSSVNYFGDRIEKGYTPLGYVAVKLTCKSPSDEIKIVRKFRFEYIQN